MKLLNDSKKISILILSLATLWLLIDKYNFPVDKLNCDEFGEKCFTTARFKSLEDCERAKVIDSALCDRTSTPNKIICDTTPRPVTAKGFCSK